MTADMADQWDHEAGLAFQAGDLEHAAQLVAAARSMAPEQDAHWLTREQAILAKANTQPLAMQTKVRLAIHGISSEDPGMAQVVRHNASLGVHAPAQEREASQ